MGCGGRKHVPQLLPAVQNGAKGHDCTIFKKGTGRSSQLRPLPTHICPTSKGCLRALSLTVWVDV